jgi:hypothetical protein
MLKSMDNRPGLGISATKHKLPFEMVILLKQFIMAVRQGEMIVEQQRQRLASLREFEPHAAF